MRGLLRILYESLLHDPTRRDNLRGPAYAIYRALETAGTDLHVLGPRGDVPALWERVFKRTYRRLTGRRYLRFPLTQSRRLTRRLETEISRLNPDAVITMFPAAISHLTPGVPVVYRLDATYRSLVEEYPRYGYGPTMANAACRMQRRACQRSTRLVTHSEWCRNSLERDYRVSSVKIRVFGNPGALPPQSIPTQVESRALPKSRPLRLLSVGMDPHRKGFDIAIDCLLRLRERGIDAELVLCGVEGQDGEGIRYVGPFNKAHEEELGRYVDQYSRADLLLLPTRWDPWAMVISEARRIRYPHDHERSRRQSFGSDQRRDRPCPSCWKRPRGLCDSR